MKKLILPIIILFIACFLVLVPSSSPAFALGFGEGGNVLDCQKLWESFSESDGLTIGGPRTADRGVSDWRFSSKKKSLGKVSGDFCDAGGIRHDTDSEGEDLNGFQIDISYFPNQEEAKANISSLKAAESVKVEDKNVSGDAYSMRTLNLESVHLRPHFLAPGNFGRTVGRVGNCVVSLSHTWYGMAEQWNTGDEYDKQAGLMDLIMEGSKIGWQKLSEVKDLQQFCGTTTGSVQTEQQSAPSTSNQDGNPISKFVRDVGNYFKPSGVNTGKDVKPDFSVDKPPFKDPKSVAEQAKVSGPVQAINSWIEEVFGEAAPVIQISDPETLNRTPKLIDQSVSQAKAKSDPRKSPYQIPVLDGEAMVKLPNSNEWVSIKEGDRIVPGSTIFTGMDTTTVLMIEDKGAVQISSFTEITVSDQGLEQASKEGKTYIDLKLHTGEVEVNVEGGVLPATLQIQTTNAVAGVRGTHFWVNYDSSKGVSIVGVYRGTVDVKDNLNNEKAVSPQNDKTEAVLVSKQFSTTKLILYGLMVAVIGAALLILKKRVFSKKSSKNKKT